MRQREVLCAVIGAVAAVLAVTGSATGKPKPVLLTVGIHGSAVVGQTLEATFEAAGDPPEEIEYRWRRCKADKPDDCDDIKDAKAATYTVPPTDVGFLLRVRVKLKKGDEGESMPTAVVSTLPPPVTPPPAPAPASPSTTDGARPLWPFPVVRITGYILAHGARIVHLRVTAPRAANVDVRCNGPRCPLRHRSFSPGRIRPLERYLRAGVAITIRVTQAGSIGKYTRVVVRSRKPLRRRDACLLPGELRPRPCRGLAPSP